MMDSTTLEQLVPVAMAIFIPTSLSWVIVTYLKIKHKERMVIIEKLSKEDIQTPDKNRAFMKTAFILIGVGVGLSVGFLLDGLLPAYIPLTFIIPLCLFAGTGMMLYYFWEARENAS